MKLHSHFSAISVVLIDALFFCALSFSQAPDPNTAKNISWMKPSEREMIREINLVRSDPAGYIQFLEYEYELAKLNYKHKGQGERDFSLTTRYEYINGAERKTRVDTVWHNRYEEELKAVESLIRDLEAMEPASVLKPDKGIYEAAKKHAMDQDRHGWELAHRGSDGSWPADRIRKYSPGMSDGGENLAGQYPEPTPREIVISLLIDAGIPGYGHRYNLLDPDWTHVACFDAGLKNSMYRWIQNFGKTDDR